MRTQTRQVDKVFQSCRRGCRYTGGIVCECVRACACACAYACVRIDMPRTHAAGGVREGSRVGYGVSARGFRPAIRSVDRKLMRLRLCLPRNPIDWLMLDVIQGRGHPANNGGASQTRQCHEFVESSWALARAVALVIDEAMHSRVMEASGPESPNPSLGLAQIFTLSAWVETSKG
jgi:hypothetical protein